MADYQESINVIFIVKRYDIHIQQKSKSKDTMLLYLHLLRAQDFHPTGQMLTPVW